MNPFLIVGTKRKSTTKSTNKKRRVSTSYSAKKDGEIRSLTKREYIMDILGTKDFTRTVLEVNPGIEETFPWLSQIATSYETYRWKYLRFVYQSTSGDLVTGETNGALGTVIMAANYNALEQDFVNKRVMESHDSAVSSKPSTNIVCVIDLDSREVPITSLYCRNGPAETGDIRFYDICKFTLATQGMVTDGGTIGELYVEYGIDFYKPHFNLEHGLESAHYQMDSGSMNIAQPYGGANQRWKINDSIGMIFPANYLDVLVFPRSAIGKYFMIKYLVQGASAPAELAVVTPTGNSYPEGYQPIQWVKAFGASGDGYQYLEYKNENNSSTLLFSIFVVYIPDLQQGNTYLALKLRDESTDGSWPNTEQGIADLYITEMENQNFPPPEDLPVGG